MSRIQRNGAETILIKGIENIFRPQVQSLLAPNIRLALRESVAQGVSLVFWASVIMALICLFFSYGLPKEMDHSK